MKVLTLYRRMIIEGVRPDSSTFTIALKACANLFDLEFGEEIRSLAVNCGYKDDVFVGSSLLNLYAKCGKMDEAMRLFDSMPKRDLFCWTTMITGFSQCGRATEAVGVYQRMKDEGLERDSIVMVGLIQVCAILGDVKMGLSIHGHMI